MSEAKYQIVAGIDDFLIQEFFPSSGGELGGSVGWFAVASFLNFTEAFNWVQLKARGGMQYDEKGDYIVPGQYRPEWFNGGGNA